MRLLGMTPRSEFGYRGWKAVLDGTKRHTLRAKPLVVGAEYMLTTGTRFKKGGPDRTGIVVRVTRMEQVRTETILSDSRFAQADGFWGHNVPAWYPLVRFLRHLHPKGIPETMYLNHFEVISQPGEVANCE